ncbi:hypothetical protein [Rhizobium leguminosarum]|uniref:hypothetical protein n=1 Tax=Rhizobium leguminosarum TaxID=384 RepID=UPI003D087BA4
MDATEFLKSYDGNNGEPARTYYLGLLSRVDADMAAADELDYDSRVNFLSEVAQTLILAERIAYRFQHINRERLYDGAIFIDDDDHNEDIYSPLGKVSSREDWKDREVPMVIQWLSEQYPTLEEYLEPPSQN